MELWAEVRTESGWKPVDGLVHDRLFQNYDLFAIMANVRNYRHGYTPIFQARGCPPDYVSGEYDRDVTTSWLTVAEIMAFDWTRTVRKRAIIEARGLRYWLERFRPFGEPPIDAYVIPDDEDHGERIAACRPMEAVLADIEAWHSKSHSLLPDEIGGESVLVEWDEPYYVAGAHLLAALLPQLWLHGRPEDVRIVFEFD